MHLKAPFKPFYVLEASIEFNIFTNCTRMPELYYISEDNQMLTNEVPPILINGKWSMIETI